MFAYKAVNDSKFTIVWHVDDLKICHKNSVVVDDAIRKLESEFGNESRNQDKGKETLLPVYGNLFLIYNISGDINEILCC